MKRLAFCLLPLILTGACAGTGAQHQPVLSAVPGPGYDQDLNDCSALAKSQRIWNPETKTQAVLGATVGALAGLADDTVDSAEGAIAGAMVGAASGAALGAADMRNTRKDILIECLRDRGHPVAG
ncbi:glycine zipper family protein [Falsiphaeobacter marinintestinus]|uniref:glycine zipper family protein n=1 Tax=Falsiphaeobacter marinintestinus TaxID=1492905 RepID=UPI0011B56C56|nr:glycine zipper family protein [Phaeobacter marinintestinus]